MYICLTFKRTKLHLYTDALAKSRHTNKLHTLGRCTCVHVGGDIGHKHSDYKGMYVISCTIEHSHGHSRKVWPNDMYNASQNALLT